VDFTDKQLAEKFAAFEKEQDPTLVYEAADLIEAAERDVPAGDVAARKRAVSRWLRFLAALDRNIDPKWNLEDVSTRSVTPPLSFGMVYSTGEVDPSTIADEAARTEYEQALKANKNRMKWYDIQFQLRGISDRAMRFVERLLAERYTNSEADGQEFEELLAESPVNELRKEQVRTLIPRDATEN
jgi:hypothetical protein